MDLDQERDARRLSLRAGGIGFSMLALGLVIASICSIGSLLLLLTNHRPDLGRLVGIAQFEFVVDSVRTYLRLGGSFFVCAALADPAWRRRSGLLLVMAMVDVGLWGLEYRVPLGLGEEPAGHAVLRHALATTLGWSKFALVAGLAADYARGLGMESAVDLGRTARATATTGAGLWFFFFLRRVNWGAPWPLVERRFNGEMLLFWLVVWIISAICLVQTSVLTLLAARLSGQAIRTSRRAEQASDPWSPSRAGAARINR